MPSYAERERALLQSGFEVKKGPSPETASVLGARKGSISLRRDVSQLLLHKGCSPASPH